MLGVWGLEFRDLGFGDSGVEIQGLEVKGGWGFQGVSGVWGSRSRGFGMRG